MKKRFLIALTLFLILTTYKSNNILSTGDYFKIREISIENNFILNNKDLLEEFSFLNQENLFLLNSQNIKDKLKEDSLIESFEIKKIYPNKIKLKIFEKKPIAILYDKKEKYYYTKNDKLIKYSNFEQFEKLPQVFGGKNNFKTLLKELKKINFPLETIQSFYFFESRRWDLVTKKNALIKLPTKNYNKSLNNYLELKNKAGFEKYKIFDYRIQDQIILK